MTNEDITAAQKAHASATALEQDADDFFDCGVMGHHSGAPRSPAGFRAEGWSDQQKTLWMAGWDSAATRQTLFGLPQPALSTQDCGSIPAEITVTAEMFDAGQSALRCGTEYRDVADIYRIMAALAPAPNSYWEGWRTQCIRIMEQTGYTPPAEQRIVKLELENKGLSAVCEARRSEIEEFQREIVMLRAERDAWLQMHADLKNRTSAFFGGAVQSDKPEPDRRPDGTLVPTAKPWGPPKSAGDPRRIGG